MVACSHFTHLLCQISILKIQYNSLHTKYTGPAVVQAIANMVQLNDGYQLPLCLDHNCDRNEQALVKVHKSLNMKNYSLHSYQLDFSHRTSCYQHDQALGSRQPFYPQVSGMCSTHLYSPIATVLEVHLAQYKSFAINDMRIANSTQTFTK